MIKGFYVGCQVKITGTDTWFLKDSISKTGTVVSINKVEEDCLVELKNNYGPSEGNQWFYGWDELEVIK